MSILFCSAVLSCAGQTGKIMICTSFPQRLLGGVQGVALGGGEDGEGGGGEGLLDGIHGIVHFRGGGDGFSVVGDGGGGGGGRGRRPVFQLCELAVQVHLPTGEVVVAHGFREFAVGVVVERGILRGPGGDEAAEGLHHLGAGLRVVARAVGGAFLKCAEQEVFRGGEDVRALAYQLQKLSAVVREGGGVLGGEIGLQLPQQRSGAVGQHLARQVRQIVAEGGQGVQMVLPTRREHEARGLLHQRGVVVGSG